MSLFDFALFRRRRGGHPNRLPFRGVLTFVDEPSDRPPSGAQGRRVLLTRQAAEAALPSLVGMAVDHALRLDGHDATRKVGVITSARLEGRRLQVTGHLFAHDFPALAAELRAANGTLGMSFEITDALVEDIRAAVWRLTEVTFTGAAILRREKAAYARTSIEVAESTSSSQETQAMNEEPIQGLLAATERLTAAAEAFSATVARLEAGQEEMRARIERIVATLEEVEVKVESATTPAVATGLSAQRKTLPPLVTALLAKSGVESVEGMDAPTLDAALASLSVEQRIAVKSQMARAGLIG